MSKLIAPANLASLIKSELGSKKKKKAASAPPKPKIAKEETKAKAKKPRKQKKSGKIYIVVVGDAPVIAYGTEIKAQLHALGENTGPSSPSGRRARIFETEFVED